MPAFFSTGLHLCAMWARMGRMLAVLIALLLLLAILGLVYHQAPLVLFNLLVPKDRGPRWSARNLAYGPDPRHRLDICRPQGAGPFPVVLFIYGGSWDSGRRQDYGFVAKAFAAQGFVTAIADYRLVPQVHYPAFVDDAARVIRWLAAEAASHGGDAARLFVVGHSAGAYSAVQAVLRHGLSAQVRAMAALAGPFDFLPLASPKTKAAFGKVADLAETQPVQADVTGAPPLLLLHGRDDTTVGLHNGWNLKAAYDRSGRVAELKFYEGVGHVGILLALARPLRRRAPVLEDVRAFFQRYG